MALVQKNINWKPYEVIYSAGEEPNGVYLIKEGTVEIYSPDAGVIHSIYNMIGCFLTQGGLNTFPQKNMLN